MAVQDGARVDGSSRRALGAALGLAALPAVLGAVLDWDGFVMVLLMLPALAVLIFDGDRGRRRENGAAWRSGIVGGLTGVAVVIVGHAFDDRYRGLVVLAVAVFAGAAETAWARRART